MWLAVILNVFHQKIDHFVLEKFANLSQIHEYFFWFCLLFAIFARKEVGFFSLFLLLGEIRRVLSGKMDINVTKIIYIFDLHTYPGIGSHISHSLSQFYDLLEENRHLNYNTKHCWGGGGYCPPRSPGSDGPATHGRAVTLHSKSGRKTLVVTLMTIACLWQFSTEKQHIAVRK